ncbi:hypothetical protein [Flavobacterium silvaticum]|uniref:Uncharacterized protein n=1 Tax=Flavobacterium silvaticum TaxID=1852020 RepID=A0A972FIC3_9FLAO|nr:hypothetical protein [Flavobacterium silvaticum]NMH26491.1 hypothetical protein [Flavobacterium silvaticum]
MNPFKIQKTGEFSSDTFNDEIKSALQKIKDENYLPGFGQEIIKNDVESAVHLNGELYSGNYLIFQIQNHSEPMGHLHCFLSLDKTFLSIIAI